MVLSDQGRFQRVYLELTNACNCHCEFCPRSAMKRPVKHINLGLAKRLLSEIAARGIAPRIVFHVMGEPSLHPHFFEILDFASRVGLHTSLVTNGMLLGRSFGQELLNHCPDELTVSVQTPDPESFVSRHAPIGYADFYAGVMGFVEQAYPQWFETRFVFRFLSTCLFEKMHQLDSLYGDTCSQFGPMRRMMKQWAEDVLKSVKLDTVTIRNTVQRLQSLKLNRWHHIGLYERVQFDIWPMLEWEDWSNLSDVEEVGTGDCSHHKDHVAILSNGDVVLCCLDFNGRTALGNVQDALLMDVLGGEMARFVFSEFAAGRVILPFCRRCLGSWQKTLGSWRDVKDASHTQQAIESFMHSECRLW